jgi:spermidine synthase
MNKSGAVSFNENEWAVEKLFPDIQTAYKLKAKLHGEDTPFQSMKIVDSVRFGKMLLLDDVVQTTEADEFVYHEMMSHIPLFSMQKPGNVLIIGGGDGGILREVLKHPSVKKATMVEIDGRVVEFSKKHLSSICKKAFSDKRTNLIIDDGAAFVKKTKEKYDVVIVDSSDPIGPATVLFTKEFYGNVKKILTPKGVMIRQSGSTIFQPKELRENFTLLKKIFKYNAPCVFAVPTYVGGFFCLTFSSSGTDPLKTQERNVAKRFSALKLKTQYYNPGIHVASFKAPEYVIKLTGTRR